MSSPIWIDPEERAHMLWECLAEGETGASTKAEFMRIITGALRLADGAARRQCAMLIKDLSDDINEDIARKR